MSVNSADEFGGATYATLSEKHSDAFDDFEIEYDEIENANDEELKEFFQRLQHGLPLTSSERLNATAHVERQVLDLLRRRKFSEREFFETREGQCRLVPPLTTEVTETLYSEIPDVRKAVKRIRNTLTTRS